MNKTALTLVLLYGEDPYVTVFLKQRGIEHAPFSSHKDDERAKILWVLAPLKEEDGPAVARFHSSGGHIIGYSGHLQSMISLKTTPVWIENMRGDASPLFDGINNILLKMHGEAIEHASCGRTNDAIPSIMVMEARGGKGRVVAYPFSVQNIRQEGIFKKKILFYDQIYHEYMAGRSYHLINTLFFNAIRMLMNLDDKPFITRSLFPSPYTGGISFRVDADYYHPEGWLAVQDILRGCEKHTTIFINTWTHRRHARFVAGLKTAGFDIQSHMHVHTTYDDYRRNKKNLEKSLEIFNKWNMKITGVASPYSIWNVQYNRCVEDSGLTYTSEFGYSYLDLPSRTVTPAGFISSIVQCGIFPIALECFLYERSRGFCDTFIEYIRHAVMKGEHIVLYLHPNNNTHLSRNNIEYVIREISGIAACWFCSMSDLVKRYLDYEKDGRLERLQLHTRTTHATTAGCDTSPAAGIGRLDTVPIVEMDFEAVEALTIKKQMLIVLINVKGWLFRKGLFCRAFFVLESIIRQMRAFLKDRQSG